ncbi:MAG: YicC family protein [Candidatus Omnitrophica bacterium]|nr:YicC family protein [Candidatus Omnitrophota bacterium]MCA9424976.1 YicC family protein [Candidatus Omnitrophota bacterium]MCA9432918.1 YicC family protein [Candidatus Omnitrophota bacterium]MCA9438240.1 YicC family protein [Candidatus Omnitrophota bacterium]MCA9439896.1 YicC family protein [Candidatus Omnitrophota bacterium]
MISSMTGYGRGAGETALGHLSIEIKSVNHRYLDSRVRLPRQLSSLEPYILAHLKDRLSRGRVEVNVTLISSSSITTPPTLNLELAKHYVRVAEEAGDQLNIPHQVSLDFILRLPEVIQMVEPEWDVDDLWEEMKPVLDEAIGSLESMRTREGESLAADFSKVIQLMREHCERLEVLKDQVIVDFRERFQTRLDNLLSDNGGLDPARLHQEVAVFADRCDICEELARLESHLKQFEEIQKRPEPVGRRLDFLLQEMFRELNTIGSKANHLEVTQIALEMKNCVERLREQVQNVE